MRRLHLLEIEDQSWCPVSLRDTAPDYLQCSLRLTNAYALILPRLQAALQHCGTSIIIDLAAGGSDPWPRLLPMLVLTRPDLQINLTDKFPNFRAFAALQSQFLRQVMPAKLRGFHTMVTAFHHMTPAFASAVLSVICLRSSVNIGPRQSWVVWRAKALHRSFSFLFRRRSRRNKKEGGFSGACGPATPAEATLM